MKYPKFVKAVLMAGAMVLAYPTMAEPKAPGTSPYTKEVAEELAKTKFETLKKNAEAGDVASQLGMARKYSQGEGVKMDHVEAVRWMRLAADQNDPKAQTMLGAAYTRGLGVPRDDAIAHNWYLLASMQGYADANYMLGMRYLRGTEGTPQNVPRGLELVLDAAEQGVPDAMVNLGIFYLKGEHVERDIATGVDYIKVASRLGNAPSFALLGVLYESGLGVPQSNKKAWAWTTMSLQVKPDSAQELATLKSLEAKMTTAERAEAAQWAVSCANSHFKDCEDEE